MARKIFIYNAVDKNNVNKFRNEIDALMINGNVYAHMSENSKKEIYGNGIKILIDPMLYASQAFVKDQLILNKKLGKFKVKPSLIKLFQAFGVDCQKIDGYIEKDKLPDNGKITFWEFLEFNHSKLIESILNFQRNILQGSDSVFLDEISDKNETISPSLLIWDKEAVEFNNKLFDKFDIITVLLDKKTIKTSYNLFIEYIDSIPNDKKVMLWVEKEAISKFEEVITKFENKNILVKFGGYNELILAQEKGVILDSIITAFGYGESRNILPVGGGLPTNKVYSTNNHRRENFDNYYSDVKGFKNPKEYLDGYCGCNLCKNLFEYNPSMDAIFIFSDQKKYKKGLRTFSRATSTAQKAATEHFVWNKIKEIDAYNSKQTLERGINLWAKNNK